MPDIKKARGITHVLRDTENFITLIRWSDNSQVTLGTNVLFQGTLGESTYLKWNIESRKKVSIPQPSLLQEYDRHIGGADLFDNLQSLYRIEIQSKKWYWTVIRFCLNGAVVNVYPILAAK
ncbi:piggyBac transposable element-derived protein 2-like [Schistocerca cancellata]|uniref:piggyBac transposable element-derived protein 2-like n=1 Tax=Schistocerca cancellata TaxID=274614 RepID=UPI002117EB54|nr:piggyBac transposable element-derived protein 2-like [Schistocerca cancellata]